jgi:hypothetical protein
VRVAQFLRSLKASAAMVPGATTTGAVRFAG